MQNRGDADSKCNSRCVDTTGFFADDAHEDVLVIADGEDEPADSNNLDDEWE